jgi:hypothetical protein
MSPSPRLRQGFALPQPLLATTGGTLERTAESIKAGD